MKKLYSVCFEFEVPVAANSVEEAKKIAEKQYDTILHNLHISECDIFPFELEECPEEYIGCLPYVSDDDNDDTEKYCQDYFEDDDEDEESQKHIQKKLL